MARREEKRNGRGEAERWEQGTSTKHITRPDPNVNSIYISLHSPPLLLESLESYCPQPLTCASRNLALPYLALPCLAFYTLAAFCAP